jgi:hypothetical protein
MVGAGNAEEDGSRDCEALCGVGEVEGGSRGKWRDLLICDHVSFLTVLFCFFHRLQLLDFLLFITVFTVKFIVHY